MMDYPEGSHVLVVGDAPEALCGKGFFVHAVVTADFDYRHLDPFLADGSLKLYTMKDAAAYFKYHGQTFDAIYVHGDAGPWESLGPTVAMEGTCAAS